MYVAKTIDATAIDGMLAKLYTEQTRLERTVDHYQRRGQTTDYDRAEGDRIATNAAIRGLEDYHDNFGWQRYYQVPDGKIHSTVRCQSCNHYYISTGQSLTNFVWLTDRSATPRADMIDIYGDQMCGVCFPEAPRSEAYQAAVKKTAQEKQAAQDVKAAAKAAKDAATPKGDDGKPLKVGFDTPKTERGARNALAHRLYSMHWYRVVGSYDGSGPHPDDAQWVQEAHIIARSIARFTVDPDAPGDFPLRLAGAAHDIYETAFAKAQKKALTEYRKAVREGR